MKRIGTSERYQNNNLKAIIGYSKFLGSSISFLRIKNKEQIISFLDTKIKNIEDDPDKRWITTWNDYLVRIKYIIALDELKSNFYNLIILDIQMSEINGMQLYREIRKKDIKTKICFLTGSQSIFDITYKFTSVYTFTFITKPVENKELIRIINDLLNR